MSKNNGTSRAQAKHRFNILDALIIIIAAAVAAVLLMAYLPGGLARISSDGDTTIIYTVEVQGVKRDLASGISVNDSVTEKQTSVALGRVSSEVEVTAYNYVRYDTKTGEVVLDEYDDLATILITITADARSDGSRGYTVNGCRIAIGAEYSLSSPNFEGIGTCISISEISGNGGAE